jgi:hypothetical protein
VPQQIVLLRLVCKSGKFKCGWEKILKPDYLNDNMQARSKTEAPAEIASLVTKGSRELNKSQICDVFSKEKNRTLPELAIVSLFLMARSATSKSLFWP